MSSPKVQGRFYFKLTDSGNLLGEYSNQLMVRNAPECACRVEGEAGTFYGAYISTWWEPSLGKPIAARLEIGAKAAIANQPPPAGLFDLKWLDYANGTQGSPLFEGEAMLSDGMLIGNYWEV